MVTGTLLSAFVRGAPTGAPLATPLSLQLRALQIAALLYNADLQRSVPVEEPDLYPDGWNVLVANLPLSVDK